MRRLALLLSSAILAAACGPEFAVVPRGGMERVVAQGEGPANGVTMVAFANQWDADPYDLADYITPIAVELYNPGPSEVRVSYVDLQLRDQSGFRYAAINPYIPATTVGEADATGSPAAPAPRPVLLAANGPIVVAQARVAPPPSIRGMGSPSGGVRMSAPPAARWGAPGGMRSGGGVWVGPPAGIRRSGVGIGIGVGGGGYLVSGGLRGYYGPRVGYWGGPWIYPPYYSDWVFFWGPSYYPARPSMDVLSYGLPEGVLPPGARVSGYLYFKRATSSHKGALDLSWDIRDAKSGASLGSLHVPLEVVHR